jgi:CRP/FNR family transcriptional regulator
MIDNLSLRRKLCELFPVIEQANPEFRRNLYNFSVARCLALGQYINHEGDSCSHLGLLISGTVRVYKLAETGREITLYRLTPGESCVLTASCIMTGVRFPAVAVSETDLEAILVPAQQVRAWMGESEAWRSFIFSLVSQRLADIISVIEEVAFRRMDARIATYLLAQPTTQSGEIETTHHEIATELGTCREVVSRILKDFEAQGMVGRSRGKIHIVDRDRLVKRLKLDSR